MGGRPQHLTGYGGSSIDFIIFQTVLVSGAKASEESAYPEEAVKAFHVKPLPTHTKGASNKPKVIHQPTK